MLGEDFTPFEQATGQENVSGILTEWEMEEAEANETDSDLISYMETLALEFENASTWVGL